MKKILGIALVLFVFLATGTVFSQSFEVTAGVDLGWGNAVYEDGGKYTNPSAINVGLGIQMGAMWKRIALLAEGRLAYVIADSNFLMWNAGAIFEYYFFVFEDGTTKIGIGAGGGYGSYAENAPYVRAGIPFIFSRGKLSVHGEYYFHDKGPVFRAGLMYSVRGAQVMDFLNKQDIMPVQ
jgi:hypothetical protein